MKKVWQRIYLWVKLKFQMTTSEILTVLTENLNNLFNSLETELSGKEYAKLIDRRPDRMEFYLATKRFLIIAETMLIDVYRSKTDLTIHEIIMNGNDHEKDYSTALIRLHNNMDNLTEFYDEQSVIEKAKIGMNTIKIKTVGKFGNTILSVLEQKMIINT